ncbi:membrane protein [Vibrio galatheae]|uniref:Membrane protein n=1 Tax=Vibrio galatheae TaxID=579748 RepID=A0A0F4NIP0_9VIBR|nr:OmpA family protein [Vibrio galatheae]KJY82977.1 membrane protein [Vibrio galatheae]
MKKRLILSIVVLLLSACAQDPSIHTTRHQIDDLRDDDRDGVINQRDICSSTPNNVAVDRQGCTEWQIEEKANVISFFFAMDQDQETQAHQAPLSQLIKLLDQHPNASVILLGDTSSEASLEYNQALAKRRTYTIRMMLERQGIESTRISEQEFSQVTQLTQYLHARKRRTIAVVMTDVLSVKPTWNIFSSEQQLTKSNVSEVDNEN